MSSKLREALEKFSAVDLSGLKFPLDGDSSAIYNADKKEITIPYWRVAMLLNEVKAAQDMAKSALAEPLRNCDVGTAEEQEKRWQTNCGHGIPNCEHCKVYEQAKNSGLVHRRYLMRCDCRFVWSQMPYDEGGNNANK